MQPVSDVYPLRIRRSSYATFATMVVLTIGRAAHAVPAVAAPLPSFHARDLTGQTHTSADLVGRPTFVAVLTSREASVPTRAWMLHAADRLRGSNAKLVTVISLDVTRIVPDAIVRSTARGEVPREQWNATWLDRADAVRRQLGLAKHEANPYVIALDARGNVVAVAHGAYSEGEATRVFGAMASAR